MSGPESMQETVGVLLADIGSLASLIHIAIGDNELEADDLEQVTWVIERKALQAHILHNKIARDAGGAS